MPFTLNRSSDVIAGPEITTTEEKVHGVLRLEGDQLLIQWRLMRSTSRIGATIKTESEVEPVAEFAVPVAMLASADVKYSWWRVGRQVRLALIASDLRAFETIAGQGGLKLDHPAELVVNVRRGDLEAAREFAAELEMAVADRAIARLEDAGPQGPTQ